MHFHRDRVLLELYTLITKNVTAKGKYVSSKTNISFQSYKMSLAFLLKRKKFNFYFATLTLLKQLKSTVIIIRNLLIIGHVTSEMPSVPPMSSD